MSESVLDQNGGAIVPPSETLDNKEIMSQEIIIVSLFENVRANKPKARVPLFDYLQNPGHKINIDRLKSQPDEISRKKYKGLLTCITPSGVFSERNLAGLYKHTGIICLDIDGKDNTHIQDFGFLRDELSKIVNVAYCSLSASGNGVFCLIPIKNPAKHKEHFNALQKEFLDLGIIIDKSCSDVTRLRLSSYDENAYTNKKAIIYNKELVLTNTKKAGDPRPKNLTPSKPNNVDLNNRQKVIEIINRIEKQEIDITGDYHQWFQIGCAFAKEFGEEGRNFFHCVSKFGKKYSELVTNTQYNKCLGASYSISIGTFFYWAREYDLT
jgi:hypothetical protein